MRPVHVDRGVVTGPQSVGAVWGTLYKCVEEMYTENWALRFETKKSIFFASPSRNS